MPCRKPGVAIICVGETAARDMCPLTQNGYDNEAASVAPLTLHQAFPPGKPLVVSVHHWREKVFVVV